MAVKPKSKPADSVIATLIPDVLDLASVSDTEFETPTVVLTLRTAPPC